MHYPSAHPAPPVWRASADPEGTAAAPVDNGARPQYPQTTATPSPSKFRMQFPQDTDPCTLKNRRISTIRLQHLKYTQGNCMRNCRDVVRTQYHAATRPTGMEGARGAGGHGRIRGDAQSRTSATRPNWYGGCQRGRRAREDSRRRVKSHISDQAPLVWRAPEGQEGLAAVLVGGGRAWPGFETVRRAESSRRGRLVSGPRPTGTPSSPAQRAARPHTPTGGAQCES